MENAKMKFCGTCGAKMPEAAQFCPKCGAKVPAIPGQSVAQNGAAATAGDSSAPSTTSSSATPAVPVAGQTGTTSSFGGAGFSVQPQTTPQTDLGMNWYKFIIYFALFAYALVLVVLAINLFTGGFYGGYAELVYLFFDGLRIVDIVFGLACLVMAAVAIYVRQQLAHFKRDAPRLLYTFIIAINGAALIYYWVASAIISSATSSLLSASSLYGSGSMLSTVISLVGSCAIWVGVNIVYFKKRAHLFVN